MAPVSGTPVQSVGGTGWGHVWGLHLPLTTAPSHHLLSGPDGTQNSFLQAGLHVQRFLECEAVDAFKGLLPLRQQRTGSRLTLSFSVG